MSECEQTPIVLDTTFVLAADSHLGPTPNGLRDESHAQAFQDLVTLLCNGIPINLVRPGTVPKARTPLLHVCAPPEMAAAQPPETKRASAQLRTVHLSTTGKEDLYPELAIMFLNDLLDSPQQQQRVADWVRFQFDDPILVDVFWDGGDKQARLLADVSHHLKRRNEYGVVLDKWRQVTGGVLFHRQHDNAASQAPFLSHADYTLAYAFFGFTKGRVYPLQIISDKVFVLPHWLRLKAIPEQDRDLSRVLTEIPRELFPWGVIVGCIAQDLLGPGQPDPDRLSKVLKGLRERTIKDRPFEELRNQKDQRLRRSHLEDFALRALQSVDWRPERIATASEVWLKKFVAMLIGFVGDDGDELTAAGFDLAFNNRWFEQCDFAFQRRFFRASLSRYYNYQAVELAVRAWISQNCKR